MVAVGTIIADHPPQTHRQLAVAEMACIDTWYGGARALCANLWRGRDQPPLIPFHRKLLISFD
jgi:hypothetical protein